jgi:hypothetical protein
MPTRISDTPITKDDGAGHHRRKQRQQPADEGRGKDAENTGSDHRAIDAEQPDVGRRRHRQHRPDRSKGHTHHHRQADADARKADALHKRRQPAGEQVGADQEGDVLRRELQRPPDNQRHGHRAGIHHQHMLQPERQQGRDAQHLVDGMDIAHRSSFSRYPHPIQGLCQARGLAKAKVAHGTNVAHYRRRSHAMAKG